MHESAWFTHFDILQRETTRSLQSNRVKGELTELNLAETALVCMIGQTNQRSLAKKVDLELDVILNKEQVSSGGLSIVNSGITEKEMSTSHRDFDALLYKDNVQVSTQTTR